MESVSNRRSVRTGSGHSPYSVVFGVEYHPFDVSVNLLDNIYYASKAQTKNAWTYADAELITGYNYGARGKKRKYIFVIGVVTGDEPKRAYEQFKQFNLCVTHSRLSERMLSDMEYHLSLVLWPWEDGPNPENYVPTICSPKNYLTFRIIDVDRKKRLIDAAADGIMYEGIAPPYVYDTDMIANMLHRDWGSSVITRYKPDEEKDVPLDKPKIIKFGRTEETAVRRLEYRSRRVNDHPYADI